MEKESLRRIVEIENAIHLAKQKSLTDAEYYKIKMQAEANKFLLTPEYLDLKKYEALSQNAKLYFVQDTPKMFVYEKGLNDPTVHSSVDTNES